MSLKDIEAGGSLSDPAWKGTRRKLFIPIVMSALLLVIFLLGDMSYLFGSFYQQASRAHALDVLVVDFDGGAIGEAVQATYETRKGNEVPTLEFQAASSEYPDESSVRDAVCTGGYWGAVYIHPDASSRLEAAVSGNSAGYAPDDTVTYIYNQARYTSTARSLIEASLQELLLSSSGAYYQSEAGQQALMNLNRTDRHAVQAFLRPIEPTSDIITPTPQGSANLYNTLNIVFPIILAFFFVVALNGITGGFNIWTRLRPLQIWTLRFAAGKIYTLFAALVISGYVWAFKEEWAVQDHVFATNWLIVWFQMDINWQVFDSVLEGLIPMQFAPLFMLTWIIMNVTSAAVPFELAAGFYRIGYAFPGYNIYSLQVRAWTGCTRHLHINLPVLFAWWVVGHVATVLAVMKRSAAAQKAAKGAESQMSEHSSK